MTLGLNKRQAGISLVELLVGMVILGIVTAAIVMVWSVLTDSFAFSTTSAKQREAARETMALLARELRNVQPLAVNSGTPPILKAEANTIEFYTTFHDADAGTPGTQPVKVQYTVKENKDDNSRDALYRTIGTTEVMVVSDVMNVKKDTPLFSYTYFDPGGHLTSAPELEERLTDRIQNIEIQLLIDVDPGRSPTEMKLTTTVQPRNLRST
jgi:type II secretory pathway pseudopilin PulG